MNTVVKNNLNRMKEVQSTLKRKDIDNRQRAQIITSLIKDMWEEYRAIAAKTSAIEYNMLQKLQELKNLVAEPDAILTDIEKDWVFRSALSASINAAFRLRPYESPYNSSG